MRSGRIIGVCVVTLLLVTAGVASVAGTAGAQAGNAPIPIDSCRTIADEGRYVLTTDIENSNQTVCIQILSSDVVFDGQGHTIDSGPNTTESVGVKANNSLTSLSNVTVSNVRTTDWTAGIYYLDATNGTIRNVNASANRRHGILLRAASNTRLRNVTAINNSRWSLYAAANTTNITATSFETRSANVSFTATDIALTGIAQPPAGPQNRTTIRQYLGAAGTSPNASLRLAVHYTNRTIRQNLVERTLRLWVTNGTGWTKPSGVNYVNIERNRVVANVSTIQNTSVFAPAGVIETPTPTPTATAAATDTAPPTATNTTTSSGNGPGFGIALALVALLAAALVVFGRR